MQKRRFPITAAILGLALWGCGGGGGTNETGELPDEGRSYIAESQQPIYLSSPPTSGPQVPKAPAPGFYTAQQAPSALVNALFHSNVVIYYDPATTSTADIANLKTLAAAHPDAFSGVVVTPRTDSENTIILTAWRHMLRLNGYDQSAIQAFLDAHLGKGPLTSAAQAEPAPIEHFADEGHTHVAVGTAITYKNDPPTSGSHYPSPAAVGFYDTPQQNGFLVHALEHSNIIIYYDPAQVRPETLTALKALAAKYTNSFAGVIVTPRTDATYEVIATAWQNWVRQKTYDATQMQQFIDLYRGKGPEQVPHTD
jgi:hypothetical protein